MERTFRLIINDVGLDEKQKIHLDDRIITALEAQNWLPIDIIFCEEIQEGEDA